MPSSSSTPRPGRVMRHLQLMVTRSCSLRCAYCRVDKRPDDMTAGVLETAVDFLFTSPSDEVTLIFFGGEPLERIDLVHAAVSLAERRAAESGKRVRYALATNGLRLDEQALRGFPTQRLQVFMNLSCGHEVAVRRAALLNEAEVWQCVNVVVEPSLPGTLSTTLDRLAASGVPRVEIFFRAGVEWPEEAASRFLREVGDLLPRTGPPLLMNVAEPIAPFLLHNDAVVDCDGNVYWSAAIYLEQSFPELMNACLIGRIDEISTSERLWRSPDDLREVLLGTYPPESTQRRILENNVRLGARLFQACGHGDGGHLRKAPPTSTQGRT